MRISFWLRPTVVLFGVLAGVPTALLVMLGSRRADSQERKREERADEGPMRQPGQVVPYGSGWPMPYAPQPPVIVVTGPQGLAGNQPSAPVPAGWFPQEAPARQFTVVGDRETLVEEW